MRHVDLKRVRHSFGDAGPLFLEMVASFRSCSNDLVTRIEDALQARDWTELYSATHGLLEVIGVFSSGSVEDLAAEMANLAHDDPTGQSPQMLDSLKHSLSELDVELRSIARLLEPFLPHPPAPERGHFSKHVCDVPVESI